MNAHQPRVRAGFTLIELLVVIAIIAILAAILFPVFITARSKARTIKCVSHGRQLGAGTVMYLNDNNDRFPSSIGVWPEPSRTEAQNYLQSITWRYYWATCPVYGNREVWSAADMAGLRYIPLKPYVKNEDVWICPDPNTMYAKRYAYGFRMSWNARGNDNFLNGDRGFCDENGVGRSISEVQALDRKGEIDGKPTVCGPRYMPPTKKIMFMCYALGRWACNGRVGTGAWPWIFPSYAHARGSVFVYADGHAAYHDMGQGWAPLNYTNAPIDTER